MRFKRALLAGAAALTLAGGLGTAALTTAPAAHAAFPATVINLPALGASSVNPNGLDLDALNWGGTGTSGICNPASVHYGQGVVNDEIAVWKDNSAGCAADWQILADSASTFQIQYNPAGNSGANLCVSTISGEYTIARLRPCAVGGNIWQTFHTVAANTDITGGKLLEAGTGFYLNDKAFGSNGSPVISYTSTTTVNAVWTTAAGPALP
jgi:hypothetical protein